MKKQTLFSILTTHPRALWQSITFSSALALGPALGAAQIIPAQPVSKIRVAVGQVQSNGLKKPVNANSIKITVNRPAIARASFDSNTNSFNFEGLSEGQTRITIDGTYRNDNAGGGTTGGGMVGGVQPNAVRFRQIVDVTVLPRVVIPNANVFSVQVERGKNRDYGIEALLGQEFAKTADNGVRWRNIVLIDGDKAIVVGDLFDNNQLKVRVTGVSQGKTTLTLQGELLKDNVWQKVTRPLEVTVSDDPTFDVWLEGMGRRLGALKNAAAQAGTDEPKLNRAIRDFEGFDTLVAAEIAKERRRPNPREPRAERLDDLREEANNNLLRVRERLADVVKQIRRIGWHDALRDLNIVLGRKPARRTFFCPPNPQKSYGTIYGTRSYLINSSLCGAAAHDGVITFAGGNITAEFRDGRNGDKYTGSRQNGVSTDSLDRNWGSFMFVR